MNLSPLAVIITNGRTTTQKPKNIYIYIDDNNWKKKGKNIDKSCRRRILLSLTKKENKLFIKSHELFSFQTTINQTADLHSLCGRQSTDIIIHATRSTLALAPSLSLFLSLLSGSLNFLCTVFTKLFFLFFLYFSYNPKEFFKMCIATSPDCI